MVVVAAVWLREQTLRRKLLRRPTNGSQGRRRRRRRVGKGTADRRGPVLPRRVTWLPPRGRPRPSADGKVRRGRGCPVCSSSLTPAAILQGFDFLINRFKGGPYGGADGPSQLASASSRSGRCAPFPSRDDVQFFAYELLCSTCTVALAPTRSGRFRPLLLRPRSARPGRGGHSASTLPRGWFGACSCSSPSTTSKSSALTWRSPGRCAS
jgi:hypothetical protein